MEAPAALEDASRANPGPLAQKESPALVFMSARNDLGESGPPGLAGRWAERDIREMKRAGATEKVDIVVERGKAGEGSRRLPVSKRGGAFSGGETGHSEDKNAGMGARRRAVAGSAATGPAGPGFSFARTIMAIISLHEGHIFFRPQLARLCSKGGAQAGRLLRPRLRRRPAQRGSRKGAADRGMNVCRNAADWPGGRPREYACPVPAATNSFSGKTAELFLRRNQK